MNSVIKERVEKEVKENKIVLYMRGTPAAPRCGFSARVIKVLTELNEPFKTEDMDSDPELWQTLAAMNNWPTSPQIFVNGEFVGGCDIIIEMARSGELKQMLNT